MVLEREGNQKMTSENFLIWAASQSPLKPAFWKRVDR